MNRYDRYPGDYLRDTIDLSMAEDGAYTRLLDWYYANERPIEHDRRFQVARAHSPEEQKITQWVLDRFFRFVGSGLNDGFGQWVHDRAELEIKQAKPKILAARINGKKGGRPPKKDQEKPSGLANENPVGNPLGKLPSPSPSPSKDLPPLPSVASPQGEPPEVPPKAPKPKAAKRKCSLPDSWQPTDAHRAIASEVGADLNREALAFRDHAAANGRLQLDWDAAFRTWLRKSPDFRPSGGTRRVPPVQRGYVPGSMGDENDVGFNV